MDAHDSVPDLNVASLQLLLRTRKITIKMPIDGIMSPRLTTVLQHAWRRGDWTGPPPARALLDWLRALPPRHVEVPRVRTPIAGEMLRGALYMGHLRALRRPAAEVRLSMATAHLVAVHGEGLADTWVWNLGNWPVDDGYRGAWCRAPGGDRRAYAEPLEGATAHWELLDERYEDALARFDGGEAEEVGRALARAGWPQGGDALTRALVAAWERLR